MNKQQNPRLLKTYFWAKHTKLVTGTQKQREVKQNSNETNSAEIHSSRSRALRLMEKSDGRSRMFVSRSSQISAISESEVSLFFYVSRGWLCHKSVFPRMSKMNSSFLRIKKIIILKLKIFIRFWGKYKNIYKKLGKTDELRTVQHCILFFFDKWLVIENYLVILKHFYKFSYLLLRF